MSQATTTHRSTRKALAALARKILDIAEARNTIILKTTTPGTKETMFTVSIYGNDISYCIAEISDKHQSGKEARNG